VWRHLRAFWLEFDWQDLDGPGPPNNYTSESGVSRVEALDWGRSESFDPDGVGDIADEGAGHRG